MDFTASLFPSAVLIAGWLITAVAVFLAAQRVSWSAIDGGQVNLCGGLCILTLVFWLLQGGVHPGLHYHLLGMTVLMLVLGAPRALLQALPILLATTACGIGDWAALGVNYTIMALTPIMLSEIIRRLAMSFLPPHLFIYLFINCFCAGALSLIISALCGLGLLALSGSYPAAFLFGDSLPFYLLLSWSEAFTSGLLMTVLVVYRPQWVATFDDKRYIG